MQMSESQFLRKRLSPITDSYQGSPASEAKDQESFIDTIQDMIDNQKHDRLGVGKKTKTRI